jgi:hypothetical protein
MITRIFNLAPLKKALEEAKQNTLVIFDVDEVLIIPTDEFRLTHPYRKILVKNLQERLPYSNRELLFSIILNQCDYRLVDPYILTILAIIKNHRIPAIALTKSFVGNLGIVESVSDKMIASLKKLQINFEELSPIKEEIPIPEMVKQGKSPLFKEGILMTAKLDKGEALNYLLQKANYYPSEILFIDNDISNLLSIQRICDNLLINFQGFEYRGATYIPEPTLNEAEEKLRFEILEKEHRWITNLDPQK